MWQLFQNEADFFFISYISVFLLHAYSMFPLCIPITELTVECVRLRDDDISRWSICLFSSRFENICFCFDFLSQFWRLLSCSSEMFLFCCPEKNYTIQEDKRLWQRNSHISPLHYVCEFIITINEPQVQPVLQSLLPQQGHLLWAGPQPERTERLCWNQKLTVSITFIHS